LIIKRGLIDEEFILRIIRKEKIKDILINDDR